jgi:ribonuclease HI
VSATPDLIEIYTDGACTGNPGPAGCGAVLIYKGRVKELSKYLGEATNNIAELTAVEIALQALRTKHLPVRIHADSTYVIGVLSGTLKVRANTALVERIRALMDSFDDLSFVKVRGHAGVAHNVRADALARHAIHAADKPQTAASAHDTT